MPRSTSPTPQKDANGFWGFCFDSVHPRPDGKRRQIRRRGFATRSECKEALREAIEADRVTVPTSGQVLTVEAMMSQYIRAKRLAGRAEGTIEHSEWAARRINERFGGWEAKRVTAEHIEAFLADLLTHGRKKFVRGRGTETTDKPLSPASVRHVHIQIKAAMQYAVDRGHLPRNPARLVTTASSRRNVAARPHWSPDQVGKFLDYAKTLTDEPIGLVEVLADTGGRRGEVLALRWRDYDAESGTITINRAFTVSARTKAVSVSPTKRPREKATIALHPATVARLKKRERQQRRERWNVGDKWPDSGMAEDLIFTWPDGQFIHPDVLTRTVARLSIKAGLPRLTPHGLRHSFATAALAARVPVEVVAARLGDTPRTIQETYAHVLPADDAATARLVGDLYRGDPGAGS